VFVVGLRFGSSMVNNTISMIRGLIDRIVFQWNTAGIDDIVLHPTRDDYRKALANRCPNNIKNHLTGTLFHAKELVGLADFRCRVFTINNP